MTVERLPNESYDEWFERNLDVLNQAAVDAEQMEINNLCEHCDRPFICVNGKWRKAVHEPGCPATDADDKAKIRELKREVGNDG